MTKTGDFVCTASYRARQSNSDAPNRRAGSEAWSMWVFRRVKDRSGWEVKVKRATVQIRQRYVPGYFDGSKGVFLGNTKLDQSNRLSETYDNQKVSFAINFNKSLQK